MSKNFKEFEKKYRVNENILYQNDNWVVSLRPIQKTPFSMLITCKKDLFQIRNLSHIQFHDLKSCYNFIENLVFDKFNAVRVNYECLMLVDAIIHFHVFPRFDRKLKFENFDLNDNYYPKPVNIQDNNCLNFNLIRKIIFN